MGYRGEDASRSPAAWGEQPPRRPAASTGTGGAGSWGDDSQDHWQGDHATGQGYDDYAGHDGYAGYGQQQGYDAYGSGGQGAYGVPDGYPQGDGYGGAAGYGQQNGYGYQQPGYGDSYGADGSGSGGYPALPSGLSDSGGFGQSGGYSSNDWYDGQPDAASGSGFADTGTYTLNSRIIDEYGTGPRHALRDPARGFPPPPSEAPALPPAAHGSGALSIPNTGQQEQYDEYGGYPGYGQDDYAGYGETAGYAGQGYDDYADGQDYGQGDYGQSGHDGALGGYDNYAEADGYPNPYDEAGAPPGDRSWRSGGGGGRPGAGAKRRKRPLLLTALAVVAVGVLGTAAYKFWLNSPSNSANAAAQQPLPTSGPEASTPACVAQLGTYCHIEKRTLDPTPLTLNEVFLPAFQNAKDHAGFTLVATKLDKTCSAAVIGQDLINALDKGNCTQVLRASYLSADGTIMGTIGVVNLSTTNQAHYAGKVVGQNDFIAPLAASKGKAAKLGQGTGVVEAEYKGHYLILTWAEFTNGSTPSKTAQEQQLEQWEADLVAGTANISLTQRMVNGAPASPGASS